MAGSGCAIVLASKGQNQYNLEKNLKLLSKSVRHLRVVEMTSKAEFHEKISEDSLLEMNHDYFVAHIKQENSQKV